MSVSADQKKVGSAELEVLVRSSWRDPSRCLGPILSRKWVGIPRSLGRTSQGGTELVGHVPGQFCWLAAITSDLQMCELPLLHPLGIYARSTVQISMSGQSYFW